MSRAEALTRALRGHWTGTQGTACCPAHEDRSPSLSIANGEAGRLLLKCFAGCGFAHIVEVLKQDGLWPGEGCEKEPIRYVELPRHAKPPRKVTEAAKQARGLWNLASPVVRSLAETYLRGRGITCALPSTLRALNDCRHSSGTRHPVLLARVDGASGFAVHRTYLSANGRGKALVAPSKAMLGSTKGGAVRLTEGHERLVVAEGVETALSLSSGLLSGSVSIWAALSASGVASLVLPRKPGRLLVAVDGDAAGLRASNILAERAKADGWEVALAQAPVGQDWNDVLIKRKRLS